MPAPRRLTQNRAAAAPRAARAADGTADLPIALTLDYWRQDEWYVGQLREVPDVFSRARTLAELRENIREVFDLMLRERPVRLQRRRRRPRSPLGLQSDRVKREAFLRELREAGCVFTRHGHRHDIWSNPSTGRSAPVPRHTELVDVLVRKIRKQLGLSPPTR